MQLLAISIVVHMVSCVCLFFSDHFETLANHPRRFDLKHVMESKAHQTTSIQRTQFLMIFGLATGQIDLQIFEERS